MANKNPGPRSGFHKMDIEAGARVRRLRVSKKISQEGLAKKLNGGEGITFQQVQKYERGANGMRVSRFVEIAEALGTTASDMLEGIGERQPSDNDDFQKFYNSQECVKLALEVYNLPKPMRDSLKEIARSMKGSPAEVLETER